MINFKKDNIRFNYIIAGVTIVNNKVLLHRLEKDDFWALPGGRCELLETSRDTLYREYFEETGLKVNACEPIWILEMFFDHEGERFHEISFIYEVKFLEDNECLNKEIFYGTEGDKKIIFKWFPLDSISDLELYPTFLREKLKNIPAKLEHIIHFDN